MKLVNYQFLDSNSLRLHFVGNQSIQVILDEHSGKIVTRDKVNTIINIQHTGIWLGRNALTNEVLIIHNHYNYGAAHVASYAEYAQSKKVFPKNETCANDALTVIQVGLDHVLKGKSYQPINHNCQTLTNLACNNKAESEDVAKLFKSLAGLFLMVLIFCALTSSEE